MLVSPDEFRNQLATGQLRLCLVGMSNSGKSTLTHVLASQADFAYFEVDEAINRTLNIGSMAEAAAWMGYPFQQEYAANKLKYLELEAIYTRVEFPTDQNFVLDTTGSIIYADDQLLSWISDHFLIVGLEVTDEMIQVLVQDYFLHPKTVIWGTEFSPRESEDGIAAMKRCYPSLLENRAVLYRQLADVQISASLSRTKGLTAELVLDDIEQALRRTRS